LSRSVFLSVMLALAGCGVSHHFHRRGDTAIDDHEPIVSKQNNAAIDQCEKLYPNSDQKPVSPRVKCFNEATLAYYASFADIQRSGSARIFANKMASIAKKYDEGQISESEFDVEKEEAITDLTNQIMRQPESAANGNATQARARKQATLLPKQMTCVPTSNGVNCY
jgi:phage-related protein